MAKRYMWTASSDDGAFEDRSDYDFESMEDCYNDMRNHALNKMKWNTEIEDFYDVPENECIGYSVKFYRNKIIHTSYSGVYTYKIEEVVDLPTIPTIVEVKSDFYDEDKHCWCIDVWLDDNADSVGVVVAKVYDNKYVTILDTDLCANPLVIECINSLLKTL